MFKKIIIAILLILTGGILMLVAASGMIKVPLLASLLGTDSPKNLIGDVDPNLYKEVLVKGNITLTDEINKYCLTCNVTYENFSPLDITLSSSELSSLLQASNNDFGPLKEIQIKLSDNDQVEMSAYANLEKYGYNFSGPIYASGSIFKSGSARINVEIKRIEFGILSVPEKYIKKGEDALNLLLSQQLSKMTDLKIDSLEISNNSLYFQGIYPKSATAK
ncbi:hypothetical protein KAJ41_02410 [Candidatus Parcubacteria bacterium]|nr:hypothetical protein [Candidatus Parcubacteria bacterium]